jgi:hypothetical protein
MSYESRAYDHFMGYDQPPRHLNVGCTGCGDCTPSGCWSEPEFYCSSCGALDDSDCLCLKVDPDEVADMIDEAQEAMADG